MKKSLPLLLLAFGACAQLSEAQDVRVNEALSSNTSTFVDQDGDASDWLELWNGSTELAQLEGFGLTDDPSDPFKWTIPSLEIEPDSFIVIFASGKDRYSLGEYHAGFKLSKDEQVCLTSPDETKQDCLQLQDVAANTSVGRLDDGSVALYATPTPGYKNEGGLTDVAEAVSVSLPSGSYSKDVVAELSNAGPGRIVYSLDGSVPDASAAEYSDPLMLTETTVLRARVIAEGLLPGPVSTHSFILHANHTLPVASIVTEPGLLFDPDTGMYVLGPDAENNFPHFGANFWQDWEIPVGLDWIEADGVGAVNQALGMKIYGGWSRGHPQKSFSLFARSRYGVDALRYRFFQERAYDEYQAIVFRNSGNDWNKSMLRDGFMQSLVRNTDVDMLQYQPAAVYLNGVYWGIHNLREKINEHYVEAISGADPDAIDLVEFNTRFGGIGVDAIHGTTDAWDQLIERVSMPDMESDSAYRVVKEMIDVDNFIDYQIAEIFFDNRDWPGNNSKAWRARTEDGRFRWILYDTDFGFGIWNSNAWQTNTLLFASAPSGPSWPNPPWSTKLFRSLLENEAFRIEFLNRFSDFLNVHFDRVEMRRLLRLMSSKIESEMENHSGRWGYNTQEWQEQLSTMELFARGRSGSMLEHVRDYFDVDDRSPISVAVNGDVGGRVVVNRESFREDWSGEYFDAIPVPIVAIPDPGYAFSHWSGSVDATDRLLSVNPANAVTVTAHFEVDSADPSAVVINELQYHPAGSSGEWIELVNVGSFDVSLAGWVIGDKGESTGLPDMSLKSGEFALLCEDAGSFFADYGIACDGEFPFGLGNGGDIIVLRNAAGVVADSVAYLDGPPWPTEPDDGFRSLALQDALSDNNKASSWRPSREVGGSPGASNVTSTSVLEEEVQAEFELSVYPNPFSERASVELTLSTVGDVVIEVFDILGRRQSQVRSGVLPRGSHSFAGIIPATASGVLIVRVSVDGRPVASKTVVHVR